MYKTATLSLDNFSPSEFGIWWPFMDKDLLLGLDQLRKNIGQSIVISPVNGALGRNDNEQDSSYHNVLKWGKVRAADIQFPELREKSMTLEDIYSHAIRIPQFGGVGVYPGWKPYPGLHVDTRSRKSDGSVAKWSGFYNVHTGKNDYKSVDAAFV